MALALQFTANQQICISKFTGTGLQNLVVTVPAQMMQTVQEGHKRPERQKTFRKLLKLSVIINEFLQMS